MNRAVFTEDTIQSDILHAQNIIDGIKRTEAATIKAGSTAIFIGTLFIPGPEDAVMAMILSKNGLTIIKGEMGYIIKKGTQVLTGRQEQKAILTITEELRKYGTDVSKLRGFDFEDYLVTLFRGKGRFTKNGREFDGMYGNVWFEAKSGDYWKNIVGNRKSQSFRDFTSAMKERLHIAKENRKEFIAHSNSPIPRHVKLWLDENGIKYFEHY
jgi:filamentous hemagglutinin